MASLESRVSQLVESTQYLKKKKSRTPQIVIYKKQRGYLGYLSTITELDNADRSRTQKATKNGISNYVPPLGKTRTNRTTVRVERS